MEDRLRRMEEARVAQQQREAEKKSLKEKQKAAQAAKAAKAEKAKKATTENGRIGDRPYARPFVQRRPLRRITKKELVLDDQVY